MNTQLTQNTFIEKKLTCSSGHGSGGTAEIGATSTGLQLRALLVESVHGDERTATEQHVHTVETVHVELVDAVGRSVSEALQ